MPKTAQSNIICRHPTSSPAIGAAASPTQIELSWARYGACRAEKHAVYAAFEATDANGTDDDIDRAHAASDEAYNRLADIWDEIYQSRPVSWLDLAIKGELVIQREKDLGGPCSEEEIKRFCREVQIAAEFAAVRPSTATHVAVAKRARIAARQL
jgi:hypothetical protein